MKAMAWFSQFGMAAMLLLLTIANPVMMCLQPGASLSAAEQACCERMGPMCASSGMTAKHSCCRITTTEQKNVLAAVRAHSVQADDVGYAALENPVNALPVFTLVERAAVVSPSPPQPSQSSLQVFRI